jgi:hypothetical protein
VRLQAARRPHPADRGMGKAGLRRHRTDRPVREDTPGRIGESRYVFGDFVLLPVVVRKGDRLLIF